MAIVGIIGANSVGKSSLIGALIKEPAFIEYETSMSPTRFLSKKYGMDFNSANPDIQFATLFLQLERTTFIKNTYMGGFFFDRTVVDNLAYLHYYRERGLSTLTKNAYRFILDKSIQLALYIDYYFLIHPEFPIVEDGVRNTDEIQRKVIDGLIQDSLKVLEVPDNKVYIISGTLEERVKQVKGVLLP